jgi:hypothetical protein
MRRSNYLDKPGAMQRAISALLAGRCDRLETALRAIVSAADNDHNSESDSLYVVIAKDHIEAARKALGPKP